MRHHDDEGQPATDDWLYFTGEAESEARYAAGIVTTRDEDRNNDNQ